MSKLRTVNQLQDFLDSELAWRVKEIANLKTAVKKTEGMSEQTLVRAGLTLLYAHWEGFIKNSATAYLNYINAQGLRYEELQNCFIVFGLRGTLTSVVESRKSATTIAALTFLRGQLEDQANLKIDNAINTESNLSSKVFCNILLSIGLDTSQYEPKCRLIDESLLRRRNSVAHGEYLDIKSADWRNLADEIILILRQVKTQIENSVAQASYRTASAGLES